MRYARVAYYCMEAWSESQHSLEDVILLAGAVRRQCLYSASM
ncbi:hypothetical protein [Scytonema sp. UIC 10036]|nr:hypothetical protein [Scytonema sp. UIC 10036]